MKKLSEILLEKLKIDKNINCYEIKPPKIGTTAYDYYGEPWEIIDYIIIKNKKKVEEFIDTYDMNGNMSDAYKEDGFEFYKDNFEYLVGAKNRNETVVWCWGDEGLCYENEKYKK